MDHYTILFGPKLAKAALHPNPQNSASPKRAHLYRPLGFDCKLESSTGILNPEAEVWQTGCNRSDHHAVSVLVEKG